MWDKGFIWILYLDAREGITKGGGGGGVGGGMVRSRSRGMSVAVHCPQIDNISGGKDDRVDHALTRNGINKIGWNV